MPADRSSGLGLGASLSIPVANICAAGPRATRDGVARGATPQVAMVANLCDPVTWMSVHNQTVIASSKAVMLRRTSRPPPFSIFLPLESSEYPSGPLPYKSRRRARSCAVACRVGLTGSRRPRNACCDRIWHAYRQSLRHPCPASHVPRLVWARGRTHARSRGLA